MACYCRSPVFARKLYRCPRYHLKCEASGLDVSRQPSSPGLDGSLLSSLGLSTRRISSAFATKVLAQDQNPSSVTRFDFVTIPQWKESVASSTTTYWQHRRGTQAAQDSSLELLEIIRASLRTSACSSFGPPTWTGSIHWPCNAAKRIYNPTHSPRQPEILRESPGSP